MENLTDNKTFRFDRKLKHDLIYCNVRPYPFEVVKKLSMVVTPSIVRAGTAFHSNQKVRNEDDTKIIPEKKH